MIGEALPLLLEPEGAGIFPARAHALGQEPARVAQAKRDTPLPHNVVLLPGQEHELRDVQVALSLCPSAGPVDMDIAPLDSEPVREGGAEDHRPRSAVLRPEGLVVILLAVRPHNERGRAPLQELWPRRKVAEVFRWQRVPRARPDALCCLHVKESGQLALGAGPVEVQYVLVKDSDSRVESALPLWRSTHARVGGHTLARVGASACGNGRTAHALVAGGGSVTPRNQGAPAPTCIGIHPTTNTAIGVTPLAACSRPSGGRASQDLRARNLEEVVAEMLAIVFCAVAHAFALALAFAPRIGSEPLGRLPAGCIPPPSLVRFVPQSLLIRFLQGPLQGLSRAALPGLPLAIGPPIGPLPVTSGPLPITLGPLPIISGPLPIILGPLPPIILGPLPLLVP